MSTSRGGKVSHPICIVPYPKDDPDDTLLVTCCFLITYDPGRYRTKNGDGWPPTIDIDDWWIEDLDQAVSDFRTHYPSLCEGLDYNDIHDKITTLVEVQLDNDATIHEVFEAWQKEQ